MSFPPSPKSSDTFEGYHPAATILLGGLHVGNSGGVKIVQEYAASADSLENQGLFPPDDEMFAATKVAYAAVHRLSVRAHYLKCGVGLTSEERAKRKG
jgi:hypothetical protein